ncbi:glycosyltransferase family 2 protein [Photobacterium damselae]|uniref:glycosyltransferase family 2 protein n=1 Tax=Photobacterium damselae TaxID=38293 RepID=UPI0035A8A9B6
MSNNLISVVIPTHDRPELLRLSILSVLEQTLQPFEIIVVDDTGSNATKDLIYSFGDEKLKFVENANNGACSSRNLGASLAKGKFVAFLDDDDIWLHDKLQKQCDVILKNDSDAVFSQLLIKYEGSNIEYSTKAKNVDNPLKNICIENFIGGTISSVINTELFKKLGGFDERFKAREEYDLWIRIIESGAKIDIVELPLAVANRSFMRKRVSSNISSYEKGIALINEKHEELINKTLSLNEKKIRLSKQYEFLAAQAVSIGLKITSVKYYMKSFFNRPSIKSLALAIISLLNPKFLIKIRSRM